MIGLIMCAGHGTRLKEETKNKPKCLVEVAGKTVLERVADHMNKHGIWRIAVNLHHFPELVMKKFGQRFIYIYEPVPTGEWITVQVARAYFKYQPFVVMNGDTITNIDLTTEIQSRDEDAITRFISKETGRHMGTTIYPDYPVSTVDKVVDCVYHDIGTPAKLKKARKYYEH